MSRPIFAVLLSHRRALRAPALPAQPILGEASEGAVAAPSDEKAGGFGGPDLFVSLVKAVAA